MSSDDFLLDVREQEGWDEWVLVERDGWWRTPARVVGWSYRKDREWTETGLRLPFHPRPPLYQGSDEVAVDQEEEEETAEDIQLSSMLPGVQVAEEVIRRYEVDAGVALPHDPVADLVHNARSPPLFAGTLDEEDLAASRERWKDNVEHLLGGILEQLSYDPLDPTNWDQDLTGSPSTATDSTRPRTPVDVIDLTVSVSDPSMEHDAATHSPHADKKSYAAAVFKDRERGISGHSFIEGTVVSPSPSKPLSASALSFVPTFNLDPASPPSSDSPVVSATYEFHFPSLNAQASTRTGARSLPPNLQRDEQGFYTEVVNEDSPLSYTPSPTHSATPKRQSASLLPSFLSDASTNARARHTSKTREIVDRLRSNNSGIKRHRRSRDSGGQRASGADSSKDSAEEQSSTSTVKEETLVTTVDGWITGVERTESRTSERHIEVKPKEDWVASLFQNKPTQSMPNAKAATATPAASHRRAPTSSTASPTSTLHSPASSVTSFGMPPTPASAHFPPPPQQYYQYQPAAYGHYVLPPPPPPPPGAYIIPPWQMQMQMHTPYAHGYMLGRLAPPGPYDGREKVSAVSPSH